MTAPPPTARVCDHASSDNRFRCQLAPGHDGMHECSHCSWTDDGRRRRKRGRHHYPLNVATAREEDREPWRDEYERDVLKAADENHIWLNAFSCVRPSDEFALRVGREVLRFLNDEGCTHQSTSGYLLKLPSQRELVLRINKS